MCLTFSLNNLLFLYLLAGALTARRQEGCRLHVSLQNIMYRWVALPALKARWAIIGQLCSACYGSCALFDVSKHVRNNNNNNNNDLGSVLVKAKTLMNWIYFNETCRNGNSQKVSRREVRGQGHIVCI